MRQALSIKQEQWASPILSFARQETLSHFINLSSLSELSPRVDQQLQKCKYCKAYPFSTDVSVIEDQQRTCEMCGAINQYKMRFCLSNANEEAFFTNHSYILPSPNIPPKAVTLILFLQLDPSDIDHFIQALKNISPSLSIPTSVIVTVGGKLAVVDFLEIPELVVLSKDNNIQEMIDETRCVLTTQKVQELHKVLSALSEESQEIKQDTETYGLHILEAIISQFPQKKPNRVDILLWIGKFPPTIQPLSTGGLCTIALLTLKRHEKPQSLIDLSRQLTEVHYFSAPETSTQLYYKLHEILSHDHLGRVVSSIITLRTNQKYSGVLKNIPERFINQNCPPIEVAFDSIAQFKMQICVEMTDQTGEHFKLIANCQQTEKRKKVIWFERVVLMSRALTHIKHVYAELRNAKKDPGFDYFFIANELQRYGEQYDNRTELYKGLLRHMGNYFKEFQKEGFKLYLPFSLIGRKELLLVFYPLWQGGILHHWDRMCVKEEGEDHLEWCMELLGAAFTPRETKIPIFYQLCIDNDEFCYIEQ